MLNVVPELSQLRTPGFVRSTSMAKSEDNHRNIPAAEFIGDVEKYMKTQTGDVEEVAQVCISDRNRDQFGCKTK